MFTLDSLGFDSFFAQQISTDEARTLRVARVMSDRRDRYALSGEISGHASVSLGLRHAIERGDSPRPTTGDWVLVEGGTSPTLARVLTRRTELRRRRAGSEVAAQIIAANVDLFFVVTSANRDFSPRRLERYLAAVRDSGAQAIIVLNKCDLVEDVAPYRQTVAELAPDVGFLALSAETGTGFDALGAELTPGRTVAFIGSSGVGKSTLVNRLLEHRTLPTQAIGFEDRGRHTTTHRELMCLPQGGLLMDTPGMRELGLVVDANALDATFADVSPLAAACRFSDCRHAREPGCALRAAVASGALSAARLDAYLALGREVAAHTARSAPEASHNAKRRWKAVHMQMRSIKQHSRKHAWDDD
jgi:ribosome biogenesis GTPase